MNVRRATIKDLEQLSDLFDAYRVFYKQDTNIEGAKAFLKQRFTINDSIIFISTQEDKIIGFTQLYPLFSSVKMQRTFVLNDLYVDTEHRRKGIAAALLEAAKDFSKAKKARGLTLETDIDNPAQKLYERQDWKKDTQVFHYTWEA